MIFVFYISFPLFAQNILKNYNLYDIITRVICQTCAEKSWQPCQSLGLSQTDSACLLRIPKNKRTANESRGNRALLLDGF